MPTVMLRTWLALLGATAASLGSLFGQRVRALTGEAYPQVVDSAFFPRTGGAFAFPLQLTDHGTPQLRYLGGDGYFAYEATAFPEANRLDTAEDRRAQLAYAQAHWTIARYYAAVLESRLRREVGFGSPFAFGALATRQARLRDVVAATEAEWNATTDDLAREAFGTDPLLRSLAFADEYAAALDTVTRPRLTYGPHGVWVYFGAGAGASLGGQRDLLRGGAAAEMGGGYRYARWRVGFHLLFSDARPRDADAEFVADRGRWTGGGLEGGYDLYYGNRLGLTAIGQLGGADLETGRSADDDERKLAGGFVAGGGLEARIRFGPRDVAERWAGLTPRAPFNLYVRATVRRLPEWRDRGGAQATVTAGLSLDAWSLRYEGEERARGR